ncbi:dnaJ homolog subfamily A member 3, mitochondrial-like [Xyrauchen texanus]|uniref:dnaJ homolog subfamily A member 3, mitochondrial-like n=1 Tax=Xyrauchen texanus TaxID=154827 RepID=UPI002242696D|nr:dnaJ homolog subfamily A member 3, mitochondrial-like [Xyrauchen texanus]
MEIFRPFDDKGSRSYETGGNLSCWRHGGGVIEVGFRTSMRFWGVPHTATQKEIKNAYYQLAKKYNPDTNPDDPQAKERFAKPAESNEVKVLQGSEQLGCTYLQVRFSLKEGHRRSKKETQRLARGADDISNLPSAYTDRL